jgi:AcrR family transcriptional regulator
MKRDTRQEILSAAKKLFNEHGYNAVSVQDIAGALGISKGNLTYYFKKKENIVEAIVTESLDSPPSTVPKDLGEMDYFLLDIQQVVQENAYYFWHHAQLSQVSPKIREAQKAVYQTNTGLLTRAFEIFLHDGLVRDEEFPGEYRRLIDTILLSGIYWLPFCVLKHGQAESADFRRHAWSILYPVLTERGRDSLRDVTGMDFFAP